MNQSEIQALHERVRARQAAHYPQESPALQFLAVVLLAATVVLALFL